MASIQPLGERGLELNLRLTNSSTKDYVVADGIPASASTKAPQPDNARVYAVKQPNLTQTYGGEVVELALRTFEPWPSTPTPGPLLMRGSLLPAGKTRQINRKIADIGVLNSPFKGILGKDYTPDFAYVCVGIVPVTAINKALQPTPTPGSSAGTQPQPRPQPRPQSSPRPDSSPSPEPTTVGPTPVLAHGTQQYTLCSRPEQLRR